VKRFGDRQLSSSSELEFVTQQASELIDSFPAAFTAFQFRRSQQQKLQQSENLSLSLEESSRKALAIKLIFLVAIMNI